MTDRDAARKRLVPALQFMLGIGLMVAAILCIQYLASLAALASLPDGWTIIRPPDEVTTLLVRGDAVWTGGVNGLLILNATTGERHSGVMTTIPFGYVRALAEDPEGGIWVAHDLGLARYVNGQWIEVQRDPGGFPGKTAASVLVDQEGTVWAGSTRLLARYDGSRWERVEPAQGWEIASVDVLFQDRAGVLWIGSSSLGQGGLYSLDGSLWTHYTRENGLVHPSVNMICQSRDGTLWIATGYSSRGGLVEIRNGTWTTWSTREGLAGENTRSVYEDSAGRLWVGSESYGLVIFDTNQTHLLTDRDGLAGIEVKIVREHQGVFWIGTSGGLSRVEGGSLLAHA